MNNVLKTNSFPGLLHNILNQGLETLLTDDYAVPNVLHRVPVNITETKSDYQFAVLAAGLSKEDFTVSLDKNLLSISHAKKETVKDESIKVLRSEFAITSFKRTFTINDQVDATKISANYTNGVLYVTLPKKEELAVLPTTIEIK